MQPALSEDIMSMLRDLAAADGKIRYYENNPPFPNMLIDEVEQFGLVSNTLVGQYADMEISLTTAGRRRAGLPDVSSHKSTVKNILYFFIRPIIRYR